MKLRRAVLGAGLSLGLGCEASPPCAADPAPSADLCAPSPTPAYAQQLRLGDAGAESSAPHELRRWPAAEAGASWVHARPRASGSVDLSFVHAHSGRVELGRVDAVGAHTSTGAFETGGRWTASALAGDALLLLDGWNGRIELWELDVAATSPAYALDDPALQGMSELHAVEHADGWHWMARDPWRGAAVVAALEGELIRRAGPRSLQLDLAQYEGQLYMAHQDPLGLDGVAGRVQVIRLDEELRSTEIVFDQNPPWRARDLELVASAEGLELVALEGERVWTRGLDLSAGDADWQVHAADRAWSSIEAFPHDGELGLVGLSESGGPALSAEQLQRMMASFGELARTTPGMQFALAQHGHVRLELASGFADVPDPVSPTTRVMTARTALELASVSKLFTGTTVLRLVEERRLALDAAFARYLPPQRYPSIDPSLVSVSLRELLTMRAGLASSECDSPLATDTLDCTNLLSRPRDAASCETQAGGRVCCERNYQNSNYHVLRWVLGELLGGATGAPASEGISSAALEAATQDLWMRDAGLGALWCATGAEVSVYFTPCAEEPCTMPGWNENFAAPEQRCASHGWHASSVDMLRYLRALRFGWILQGEAGELLTDDCGEHGWTLWDEPWEGEYNRGKSGALNAVGKHVSTYVVRLPGGVDASLMVNAAGFPAREMMQQIWDARGE